VKFNVVRLRENIELGQRVEEFEIDRWVRDEPDGKWEAFAQATSIGACRLIRLADDITTNRVRLRITQSAACPAISDFGLFLEAT
jgi:alpha-L-fucosidase